MGFLAPWFLGGLAALGVPVFVHLLRKHVTTPRPVSSLMFFERGTQSSARHRRLRYLLLFALRFALVLLIVLAFANPFVRRAAANANGRLMLIVLDNSFSMRAGTRFADAKQQALALLAGKANGEKAQIMALGGELDVLLQPTGDEAQLRAALQSIEPGDGHANFGELGRALRTLSETARGPIDLHLFSDMQRSAMPANFADMVMPENVTLVLHPVAQGTAPPNWTVESVNAPAQLSDPKNPKRSRVEAVVAGFGTPAASKMVSLVVNGKVDVDEEGERAGQRARRALSSRLWMWDTGSTAARCGSRAATHFLSMMPASSRCGVPIRSGFCSSMPRATSAPRSTSMRRWNRLRRARLCCNPWPRSRRSISILRGLLSWCCRIR